MHQLQDIQMKEDFADIDSLLNSGSISNKDATCVMHWIGDSSQIAIAIAEALITAIQKADGSTSSMEYSPEQRC